MSWAINKAQKENDPKATVLKVEIDVNNKYFLNLNSREHLFRLKSLIRTIQKELHTIKYELSMGEGEAFDPHVYRCAMIDLIPHDKVKVIQNNFNFEQPRSLKIIEFEQMEINMHSIQVCVRDSDFIKKENIEIYRSRKINKSKWPKRNRNVKINY